MSFTSEYINLLIKQYWEKTKAKAEITLQSSTWQRVFDWLASFENEFDLTYATGERLDIIGRIVGVDRAVPSVLLKIYFGFDENPDVTGFDDKFDEIGDLGPFFDKFSPQYGELVLDDSDYRFFIEAKISRNITHGVMASGYYKAIQKSVLILFDYMAYVQDNFDMSLTLFISPLVNEERLRIITSLDLLPRPQGVRYIIKSSDPTETFGFDDNINSKGFKNKDDPIVEPGGLFSRKLI